MTEMMAVLFGVMAGGLSAIILLIILEFIVTGTGIIMNFLMSIRVAFLALLITLLAQVAVSLKWVALKLRKRQDVLLGLCEDPNAEPPATSFGENPTLKEMRDELREEMSDG